MSDQATLEVYHDLRIDLNFDMPISGEEVMRRVQHALLNEFKDDVKKVDASGYNKVELPLGLEGMRVESHSYPAEFGGGVYYQIHHPIGMRVTDEHPQYTCLKVNGT